MPDTRAREEALEALIGQMENQTMSDGALAGEICRYFMEREDYPSIAVPVCRAVEGSIDAAISKAEPRP